LRSILNYARALKLKFTYIKKLILLINVASEMLIYKGVLMEETGVHREHHRPVSSHWQALSHYAVSSTPRHERGLNSQL
jgi:hypothetical protein